MDQEELQTYTILIEDHAWVALKKIKKPTIYTHEDLVSEGIVLLLEAEKIYQIDKKASFKTFFIHILRNYFCDIIKKSYSPNKCFVDDEQREDHMRQYYEKHKIQDPSNLAQTNLLLETLTEDEIYYAVKVLLSHQSSASKRRKEARKALQISIKQEDKIKMSIFTKLQCQ